MHIRVKVYEGEHEYERGDAPIRSYVIDHEDASQRRVLGEQCRNAFEGGQVVVTHPEPTTTN